MEWAELIWKITELTFSSLMNFIGMIILILTIRGAVEKTAKSIKRFSIRVKEKYIEKLAERKIKDEGRRKI